MPKALYKLKDGIRYCSKHDVPMLVSGKSKSRPEVLYWVCRMCQAESNRRSYARNPELHRKRRREWVNSNQDKSKEVDRKSGNRLLPVGDFTVPAYRARSWYSTFRLRPKDVLEMYEAQGRKCMFGGEPLPWDEINVEHQHGYPGCIEDKKHRSSRGCPKEAVRGLSCRYHNTMEGRFSANPEDYMKIPCWHARYNGGEIPCHCKE